MVLERPAQNDVVLEGYIRPKITKKIIWGEGKKKKEERGKREGREERGESGQGPVTGRPPHAVAGKGKKFIFLFFFDYMCIYMLEMRKKKEKK